jgi:hypothetical protein
MIKHKIVFILTFVILLKFPLHIFSQEKYSLRFNTGFTFILEHNRYDRGLNAIWSPYLTSSFQLKKHEFIAGTFYQLGLNTTVQATSPGVIVGYRFYFFKELTRFNTFFNYTFMYAPGKRTEYPRTGPVSYRYDRYYDIFGCGFNIFFDKQHRLGISGTVGYPIIIEKIAKRYEYYWNRISFTAGLTFKIPLNKKKNITDSKS